MPGSDPAAQFLDVPSGIGHSTCEDTSQELTPERQADDVHRLLSALGGGPADIFGSSGGAVGLALVTAHPARVRAHFQDVYDTDRADGPDQAMPKFMAYAGLGEPPGQEPGARAWTPTPEQVAAMRADAEVFLAHLLRPTTNYRPDLETLRAATPRIVVAVGETSKGQLAQRTAQALADRLGTPAVEFPGDHVGFITQPGPFAQALYPLLRGPQ
jgi:pimeloyl-ACP methyl ester carboxylesterase